MVIAIVGSRTFNDYKALRDFILKTLGDFPLSQVEIVSGGAQGADSLGQAFANEFGLKITIHYPDWSTYGKYAGYLRNDMIIRDCDMCFAFWDGISRGTSHSISLCQRYKKTFHIYRF